MVLDDLDALKLDLEDLRIPGERHDLVGKSRIWRGNTGNSHKDLEEFGKILREETLIPENCRGLIKRIILYLPESSFPNLVDTPGAETIDRARAMQLENSLKEAVSIFYFWDCRPISQDIQTILCKPEIMDGLLVR